MDTESGLTRRELLRRGAKIGGAVWAVPVVQALGMSSAQAQENGGSSPHASPHTSPHTSPPDN